MKLKVRVVKENLSYFGKFSIGQIVDVKFYPFNPEEFYQTIDSSTFAPELLRITDCEVIPEEEPNGYSLGSPFTPSSKISTFEKILSLFDEIEPAERIQVFEKIKLKYNFI